MSGMASRGAFLQKCSSMYCAVCMTDSAWLVANAVGWTLQWAKYTAGLGMFTRDFR